jgi:hypothetical protein
MKDVNRVTTERITLADVLTSATPYECPHSL